MAARATTTFYALFITTLQLLLTQHVSFSAGGRRKWNLLLSNVGISAMHMQLLRNDRVVMFDRTNFGPSNISLPNGTCRNNPNDPVSKIDCTAHSIEYDVASNTIRPLTVQSNTWCSSGSVRPDGVLVQTGGDRDGELKARTFSPNCNNKECDWVEINNGLAKRRWYSSNHILPNGQQIVIGGQGQFNYEFYPKTTSPNVIALPFLAETNDRGQENNLYPFVFLCTNGNLFIFANNRAIILDYFKNTVVKTFPAIPGGDPRSYPSTGSAVLLPLKNLEAVKINEEVLVCGGAPKGSYILARRRTFVKALDTCARIKVNDENPQWTVEKMPRGRVMGDMTLLPNGDVLLINGGSSGSAGWELGREPVLIPDLYHPENPVNSRFESLNPSTIPRMYHSAAILLRDGRVLVGGSNPHAFYNFTGVLFPTELSLEAFSPVYLEPEFANLRPKIMSPKTQTMVKYSMNMKMKVKVVGEVKIPVKVTMVFPSFTTHSFSMNQRLLILDNVEFSRKGKSMNYEVQVRMPRSANIAPPSYYMIFVVNQNIPSEGIWVRLQ